MVNNVGLNGERMEGSIFFIDQLLLGQLVLIVREVGFDYFMKSVVLEAYH